MDKIEDVLSGDVYGAFVVACKEQGLETMEDLLRSGAKAFSGCEELTPALQMRIKSVLAAYCRQHPDLALARQPARTRRAPAPAAAGAVGKVRDYFAQHADTLIRIADVAKATGLKRGEIGRILEAVPWCKMVDSATFFYVPADS